MEADLSYPQPAEVVPLREGIPSDVTQTEPSGAGEKAIASPEEAFSGLHLVPPPILARLNAPSGRNQKSLFIIPDRLLEALSIRPSWWQEIAGLKSPEIAPKNPSGKLLRDWIEGDTFVWLVSDEILLEYKRILGRLGIRRQLIGKIVNLLREEAELVPASAFPNISADPGDDPFCGCAEAGRADFIVTLNPKDFPQSLLSAHVIRPGERIPTTARRKHPRRS
jgi:predicted nucleic acid-binding protein